jgi:DNA polymerase-3 subunit alpha
MADKFVNLHGHSKFSLLDGMTDPAKLVDYTLQIGQPASCITDHGVMYSIVDHFQYAEGKGQKSIAGFEAYVVPDHTIKDKAEAQSESESKREHLVLLAANNDGYKRITKMCSVGTTDGFYYRPRIDDKVIQTYGTEGVIAMSACLAGRIAQRILKDDIEGAEQWAAFYAKLFNDNFYLELQPIKHAEQVKVNKGLIEIHKKLGIPVVATTDFHYLKKEHAKSHDVLLAMQSHSLLSDPNRWKFPGDTFYVMTREEISSLFKQNGHEVLDQKVIEEALDNTVEIAEKCNVSFEWGKHYLPKIDPPADNIEFNMWASKRQSDGSTSADYLRYLCIKGLKDKKKTAKEYRERLDYELGIINNMGFPDYFLIMEDIMRFCRESDIPVGPARGSGGGSLVAYACGITGIDPLEYGLIFERFLNPERGKLPDIDSDFCVKKGWMVFDYLIKKYGKEYCCNIATFGRLQLKAVIKDIAKCMDVPFEKVNEFTKMIPAKVGEKEIKHVGDLMDIPELASFIKEYPELFEHAAILEGSPRHVSQHPAGICVTPIPVTDLLPVQNAKETEGGMTPGYLSQFEKDQSEQSGVNFNSPNKSVEIAGNLKVA